MTWAKTDYTQAEMKEEPFKEVAVSPSRPLNRETIHCLWQWFSFTRQ
jgi:hypothetical protein